MSGAVLLVARARSDAGQWPWTPAGRRTAAMLRIRPDDMPDVVRAVHLASDARPADVRAALDGEMRVLAFGIEMVRAVGCGHTVSALSTHRCVLVDGNAHTVGVMPDPVGHERFWRDSVRRRRAGEWLRRFADGRSTLVVERIADYEQAP